MNTTSMYPLQQANIGDGEQVLDPDSLPFNWWNYGHEIDESLGILYGIDALIAVFVVVSFYCRSIPYRSTTTMFYILIICFAVIRSAWFFVPKQEFSITYVPNTIEDRNGQQKNWLYAFLAFASESLGSLFLYAIFVLIMICWSDMLKSVYDRNLRPSNPMRMFFVSFFFVFSTQTLLFILFWTAQLHAKWFIVSNSMLIIGLSVLCVIGLSVYSYRLRTVLQALNSYACAKDPALASRITAIARTTRICNGYLIINCLFQFYVALSIFKYDMMHVYLTSERWSLAITLQHLLQITTLALLLCTLVGGKSTSTTESAEQTPLLRRDLPRDEDQPPSSSTSTTTTRRFLDTP